jgi:hypothetical protein
MDFDKVGGRKFVLAIVSLIAGLVTHVLSVKGLTSEVVGLIVGVIGTFSVANTVATVKAPGSQEIEADVQLPPPAPPVDNGQTALLEQIAVTVGQTQQLLINAMQAGNQQK